MYQPPIDLPNWVMIHLATSTSFPYIRWVSNPSTNGLHGSPRHQLALGRCEVGGWLLTSHSAVSVGCSLILVKWVCLKIGYPGYPSIHCLIIIFSMNMHFFGDFGQSQHFFMDEMFPFPALFDISTWNVGLGRGCTTKTACQAVCWVIHGVSRISIIYEYTYIYCMNMYVYIYMK